VSETLPDIVATIDIDAPPEVVWPFLVEDEHVPRWLGCMEYRKEPGQVFYMQPDPEKREAGSTEGATHCAVQALDPPRRFVFSWYLPGTPETTVAITLEPRAGGTRVTLTHSGWDQFEPAHVQAVHQALAGGWEGSVLPNLKGTVEGG
jgi:uncharacterized protein YndB with AHSA1/START domain